jgi:serine/threonine protein kinase/dienelactone hydrolase
MIGSTISHYKILEKLGEGGMVVVYKAEDTKLHRLVALKFLPRHLTADKEAMGRFEREAQSAAILNHPHIVTIYEINEYERQVFIAMEYLRGRTLSDLIHRSHLPDDDSLKPSPLSLGDIISIITQIAEGLAEAHKKDIIHRDIKPQNILVDENGQARIMDFGLAKLKGISSLTREASTLGTTRYMSPEQVSGKEVDQRSDVWSLGVVLYEMLTGQPPFKGDYEQAVLYSILNENPEPLTSYRQNIPAHLMKVVSKSLEKNPNNRYQNASEMITDLKVRSVSHQKKGGILIKKLKKPLIGIPVLLLTILIAFCSIYYYQHTAKIRWAKKDLLPRINNLAGQGIDRYPDAYHLAVAAEKYIPRDPDLINVLLKVSVMPSILTGPPGAAVYIQRYDSTKQDWTYLGITPIEKIRMPAGFFRFRLEKEGFERVLAASANFDLNLVSENLILPGKLERKLDQKGSLPPGMVRVTSTIVDSNIRIDDFLMDRYEVTNKQYKEFIDRGGYQKKEYWKNKFIRNGKEYTWEQAMKEFVDQTGRPGPAAWQAGDYPEGEDDHPVGGISWYEAAAYAEYAGKFLPSGVHWGIARGEYTSWLYGKSFSTHFTPQSNFKGKGPEPAGYNTAITPFGLYDMGGNVREWCWNQTGKGRLIRGGAWDDIPYMFGNYSQLSPFDRSSKNGFRCVRYLDPDKIPPEVLAPIEVEESIDYYRMKPVPDPIFQVYRDQFSYDPGDLNARVEWRKETDRNWIQEKISFAAAYEKERVVVYLFLPENSRPPYHTIIYFPTASAQIYRSSENLESYFEFAMYLSSLVKNGRVVVYPIYKGTFERGDETGLVPDENSHQYAELFIKMIKDLRRCIDYLETRKDIDKEKLAYLGISWGAKFGAIIPAVEERLKVSILNVGGLWNEGRSEIRPINYVGRVKIPTLMLNGRYDMTFSYELSVKPMFDLLGTPPEQKELKLYPYDHIIPRNEFIRETLNWLDKYLGPVLNTSNH